MRGNSVLVSLLVVLVGCAPVATGTPTPAPAEVGMTPEVLGLLIEEHVGAPAAVTGGSGRLTLVPPTEWVEGISATAYYRARPGQPGLSITLSYSPTPYAGSFGCTASTCEQRGGVLLRHDPEGLVSPRERGFVEVTTSAEGLPPDLLDAAIALAGDPRIAPAVEPDLASAAAANPRWRTDDLGCGAAAIAGPIALPAPGSGPLEPVTPQALAAVVASHVGGSCAGDASSPGAVRAIVYLGADTDRLSLAITEDALACDQLDHCEHRGDVTLGRSEGDPPDRPFRLLLSRPAPDGTHWVTLEHATHDAERSRIPLPTLIALVTDPRVGAEVDAALNHAGDDLPLRWRYTPHTVE
ncbi:MAG: hypothetical protein AAGC63_16770 [Propionicimonas sp.]|nr:hypothetical protein [Propionicimonas sp.]